MDWQSRRRPERRISRREALRLGAGAAGATVLAPALAACSLESDGGGGGTGGDGDRLVFLSNQLAPTAEAERMRREILAGFDRDVNFVPEEGSPFIDRVVAEAEAGESNIDVLGALHGDMSTLHERGLLADVSDLTEQLADRGFNEEYLELARLGGDAPVYIPWMQATYIMMARQEALDYLPSGADVETLTYDQLVEWAQTISDEEGSQRLGYPAGPDGLIKRLFQGYTYPSFTGALNTQFMSPAAETMWEWVLEAWALSNPQSVNYGFMQEPLLAGEVWVGWDHTARLMEALRTDPDAFVAFPAPVGPEGRGFQPAIVGLALPQNAPDVDASAELIDYLTRPETASVTLQQVAFFPPFEEQELPDLEEGMQKAADAIEAQAGSEDGILSLLPVGLGEQTEAYDDVFVQTFEAIVLDGTDISPTLESQGQRLQAVLDEAEAPCWRPDPEGGGTCQVG